MEAIKVKNGWWRVPTVLELTVLISGTPEFDQIFSVPSHFIWSSSFYKNKTFISSDDVWAVRTSSGSKFRCERNVVNSVLMVYGGKLDTSPVNGTFIEEARKEFIGQVPRPKSILITGTILDKLLELAAIMDMTALECLDSLVSRKR